MVSGRRVAKICILYILSATFTAYGEDTSKGDKQSPTRSRPVNLCKFHSWKFNWKILRSAITILCDRYTMTYCSRSYLCLVEGEKNPHSMHTRKKILFAKDSFLGQSIKLFKRSNAR